MKDVIDEHFEAVDKLIEANNRASDLHREASNKAYYNAAIDHAIEVVNKYFTPEDEVQEYIEELTQMLTSLKKK